jgi:hypothetical protein
MKTKLFICLFITMLSFAGFSQVGPGEIDLTFNGTYSGANAGAYGGSSTPDAAANGNVYDTKVYPLASPNLYGDKVIIVGRFTYYNNVSRKYIARLNADGTLDTTFAGPTNISGYIYAVQILANDKIIIAGSFSISGVSLSPLAGTCAYKNIACLNADGSVDNTFDAYGGSGSVRGTNDLVHALALDSPTSISTHIFIGGNFTSYSSAVSGTTALQVSCGRVLKLNNNGSINSGFTSDINNSVTGEVRSIAWASPYILVGGLFTGYKSGGVSYTRGEIIRQEGDGSINPTNGFNVGAGAVGGSSGGVYMVQYKGARAYISGRFDSYNGNTAHKGFVKVITDDNVVISGTTYNAGSFDPTFTTPGVNEFVFCFVIQGDNKIIVGGTFDHWGGSTSAYAVPKGMARLKSDGTLDNLEFLTGLGFDGGTDVFIEPSTVRRITLQSDSKILVGGDYTLYNGTSRRMICRIKTRECKVAYVYDDGNTSGTMNANAVETTASPWPYVAILSGTYSIGNTSGSAPKSYYACELEVYPNATLIINKGSSLTVNGTIMNNGTFTVNDTGNLVQVKDNVVNADQDNGGIFNMIRKTAPVRRFDYTYWSSPVIGQTLYNLSPGTLSDKYYSWNAVLNNWVVSLNGAATMLGGAGYIVRAPTSYSVTVPSVYTATFTGKPNNGIIKPAVYKTAANDWNLIGNPYPCSIDADLFLNQTDNVTNLQGTIYFWTHTSVFNPSTGVYTYVSSDYLIYNVGTGTVMPSPTGSAFNGQIAAGQGFFVFSKNTTGFATFNNSMRTITGNTQFYRTASAANADNIKNRFWLNLTNDQGDFNQMLVGYIPGATNDFDDRFDSKSVSTSKVRLYTINDKEQLSIQGRAMPFTVNDEVPLGMTATAGTFQISLDHFDGLFSDQDVFIKDSQTNTVHNLKDAPYTFTTEGGTFEDRFTIIYKNESGSTQETTQDNLTVATNDAINLSAQGALIKNVIIFDVTGKKLYESNKEISQAEFSISSIVKQNQMLIVKVTLDNNETEVKKIIY